jgi:DNA-binding transcriptional LysR family regulator
MLKRSHLRQFLAVVETGGFTAAARAIGVTQPTLSQGIAELERAVGAPLLLRERRAVRLTEAGNRLLTHARAIEREFRAAEAGLSSTLALAAPPLRLGVLPSLCTSTLAAIGNAYASEGALVLIEGNDAELRRRLAEGQADALVTLLRDRESVQVLLDESYCMILPVEHRLAGRARIDPRELADETMIARRSCELLAETSRFFTQRGVRPRFVLRSANDDRCLAMVRAGLGVTTGPQSLASDGLIGVALDGYDYRRRIGLLLPRDRTGGEEPAILAAARAAFSL